MTKLLRAEFKRLSRSKFFIASLIFTVLFAAFLVAVRYFEKVKYSFYDGDYSDVILIGAPYLIFVIAAFVGLFVGTEFSDGTVRNKLVAGHRRICIYLSELVVLLTASLSLLAAYLTVVLTLGRILIGKPTQEAELLAKAILLSALAIAALTALYVLVVFAVCNKASGAVFCLVGVIAMSVLTLVIFGSLMQPEFYYQMGDGVYVTDSKDMSFDPNPEEHMVKNPDYPTGLWRDVLEFLDKALPTSQIYELITLSFDMRISALLDAVILFGSIGAGILIFRKKDLK